MSTGLSVMVQVRALHWWSMDKTVSQYSQKVQVLVRNQMQQSAFLKARDQAYSLQAQDRSVAIAGSHKLAIQSVAKLLRRVVQWQVLQCVLLWKRQQTTECWQYVMNKQVSAEKARQVDSSKRQVEVRLLLMRHQLAAAVGSSTASALGVWRGNTATAAAREETSMDAVLWMERERQTVAMRVINMTLRKTSRATHAQMLHQWRRRAHQAVRSEAFSELRVAALKRCALRSLMNQTRRSEKAIENWRVRWEESVWQTAMQMPYAAFAVPRLTSWRVRILLRSSLPHAASSKHANEKP